MSEEIVPVQVTIEPNVPDTIKGAFAASLTRRNTQIRNDRAIAITEGVELVYKRLVEDLQIELKQLRRDQESALDLSPEVAISLKPAIDINFKQFVETDMKVSLSIRNVEIRLDIARRRYEHLFGGM